MIMSRRVCTPTGGNPPQVACRQAFLCNVAAVSGIAHYEQPHPAVTAALQSRVVLYL